MFKNNISVNFIINMIINILLSSILIPTLFKYSNDKFTNDSNIHGMYYVIIAVACNILSTIHKDIVIEPNKDYFTRKIHCALEKEINKNIKYMNWNKLRDLNKNKLDRKKDMAKWYILGFINNIINTFISLFSFFGYISWVGMIFPFSLLVYIILIVLLMIYYPHRVKSNNDKRNELWTLYSNLTTNLYTDITHHTGDKTLDDMEKCINSIEQCKYMDKQDDSRFTNTINIIFNIGFIINCILIINFISLSSSNIIIYVQYSNLMKNSVIMCMNMYTTYKDAKREYLKLDDIISDLPKRVSYEQIKEFTEIRIDSLKYTYQKNKNISNIPFTLTTGYLKFTSGELIMLTGNSGSGKSTFSDINNGIIPCSQYTASIFVDGVEISGFDCLTSMRYYNEQIESHCYELSIYEIISGNNNLIYNNGIPCNINKYDEDIVWSALTICSCLDFLKRNNIINELEWIHTKNIGMSGGQKSRIALARSIYRIMTRKPKMITLDEVDKAIQSEMVVQIMQNIYRYTRENNILTFVICHNPDVKKLTDYNQVINFVNGVAIKKSLI
jgi:ABC-type multidrug transport system fused ATPase/permease subunit